MASLRNSVLILLLSAVQVFSQDWRSIQQNLEAGKYADALEMARSALQTRPNDVRLWTLEGIALSRMGRSAEALATYKHALRIEPNYLPALEGAAEIEYQRKNPDAKALLTRIVSLRPNDQTAHAMLGAIAFARQDCSDAVEHFRRAAELISANAEALGQDGVCNLRLKNLGSATSDFQKVLALRPDASAVRPRLAIIYLIDQKNQEALDVLQPLVATDSPDPDALALSADAYEAMGKTPEAVSSLRQAIVLRPDKEEYYLHFADLCFTHSSYDAGVAMLTAGLKRLPKSASIYLARGVLYVQKAEYDKGEADFEMAGQLDPRQGFVPDAQVLVKMESNQSGDVVATARAKAKQHPKDAFLHALLAETLVQSGARPGTPEFNEACDAALRAIELNPKLGLAHNILGGLHLKDGKLQLAAKECRTALDIDPADQVALYHLVQALRKSNQPQEIPSLLKKLAELRAEARKKEAEANRYKLVEQPLPPNSGTGSE